MGEFPPLEHEGEVWGPPPPSIAIDMALEASQADDGGVIATIYSGDHDQDTSFGPRISTTSITTLGSFGPEDAHIVVRKLEAVGEEEEPSSPLGQSWGGSGNSSMTNITVLSCCTAPSSPQTAQKMPVNPQANGGGPPSEPIQSISGSIASIKSDKSDRALQTNERWWSTMFQVAIPFFIAGTGTIGAGLVLGSVQHWVVFRDIKSLFILVPALVGLKGNLDTCLASRLSTHANLGSLGTWRMILPLVTGNISLVQVQAIVAGFLVAIFALGVGFLMDGCLEWKHAIVLCASSITTATCSCFILDFLLIAVIITTKKLNMNPDNLASPFAASIGDVVSLSLLSVIASELYKYHDDYPWVPFLLVGCYLFVLLPIWVTIVMRNEYVRSVLTTGWIPVLSALTISGMGGLVLDTAVDKFNGFVVFQPIINGIGGNLVSIQSSRIATMLHQTSLLGILPLHSSKIFVTPWKALIKGLPQASSARILVALSIPGQIVFVFTADYLHASRSTLTWPFVLVYLSVSILQVSILLYMAHALIHVMWIKKIDPDSAAVPYLTATGDLLGTGLLAVAFIILKEFGVEYTG